MSTTSRQRAWMLMLLVLLYMSHFVDRIILAVVAPGIKRDLNINDTQFGTMTGLAFAFLYIAFTLPFARLVESGTRVKILAGAVIVWSLFTALGGAARSFVQLLACRIAVSIGEAAWTPTANSLIADTFPPHKRSSALSILSLGSCLGSMIGAFGGGWIAEHFGWRMAMIVVGLPGVLLGVLVATTLREPVRGQMDESAVVPEKVPSFQTVISHLGRKLAFVHMVTGGSIATFVTFAIILFLPMFLSRAFGMSATNAGLALGVTSAGALLMGQLLGGHISDWFGRRDARWYAWMPAIAMVISAPTLYFAFGQTDQEVALGAILLGTTCLYFFYGPTYGSALNMAGPRMHAYAAGILLMCTNIVGMGLGPFVAGAASDYFANSYFWMGDYQSLCVNNTKLGDAADALRQACDSASAEGLRSALMGVSTVAVWGAAHYLLAARTIRKDLAVAGRPAK
jgi:MFS family permease